jgi:glycosyltransferase involved in cell wall biosynthesis
MVAQNPLENARLYGTQTTEVSVLPEASILKQSPEHTETSFLTQHSLSVILPCYNEENIIAHTISSVLETLAPWVKDLTVIVVNDGSKDQTQSIVKEIAAKDARVHLIQHSVNQGYGAALVSGFEAVTTDLAFFTDSDGQFDIGDLKEFFPLINKYDAVLGYRVDRQDTAMRKLNAWGWKMLVCSIFGFQVRDVDCAFKLYHADFFHKYVLETRGAMINTEILYKLKRYGYTFTQVGVKHLPRTSGKATGAKPAVILRALRELFIYARKWHQEEKAEKVYTLEMH